MYVIIVYNAVLKIMSVSENKISWHMFCLVLKSAKPRQIRHSNKPNTSIKVGTTGLKVMVILTTRLLVFFISI